MAEPQSNSALHEPPAAPVAEAAGRFEDECIDLLCKQENTLSLLGEASRKRRALDSLDLAKQMLLQFLDFAESHFDEEQLQSIAQRLYVVNQRTREYEKLLVAKSFRLLRRVVRMKVPTEEAITEANEQLCNDYMDLYNEFFANCAERFAKDSAIRDQFLESVSTFLVEFDERW